ncbi:TonB-dependent receptor [Paenalcaligenes niemegkensis]|uniref:TonB-dependent receptor plug domain-containing protein n=1 Tax=Paenalcaligenes niemegkensis TaxID=2895469 RepID=UPI001EE866B4|nr:TonB-dependent receptor [Paenalcaligenes niemegkensis]MCQ9615534.1 TonB-dependent receptor [Paenalcaligenes niemegkensis]
MSFILNRQTAAVLACFLPWAVSAQSLPSVSQLENVIVTASRTAQLESAVIGDVSVIDAATIQRAGQSSVADLLSREHGIEISNTGGPQAQTGIFIRGNESKHTLVLVDGVRINSSVQGSVNLNAIDPSQIEQIEIVRGAGSSLYGAEAIGGVVNIITKKGATDKPASLWANMGLGSHDTFKSSAGISGAANGFNYSLSGSLANSDGFNATNRNADSFTYNGDTDGYDSHSVVANLGYAINENHRIDTHLFSSQIDGDFDTGGDPAINDHIITHQQAYGIGSTHKLTENWTSRLRIDESRESVETRAPNASTPFSRYQSTLRNYAWQNDFQLSDAQQLTALVEHTNERVKNEQGLPVDKRSTNSAALIYSLHTGPHHAQVSVRHDHMSKDIKRTTGGVGYDFDINNAWSVGGSYNTGFKVPDFTALYGPWGSNTDLKPETSKNAEARITYRHESGKISLVAYENRVKNLINSTEGTGWTYENIDKARMRGVSLTMDQRFNNLNFWGSADFTNPRNRETDERLLRRAAQNYKLGADYQYQQLLVGAEYSWAGKRSDFGEVTLGSYSLLNLTAEYPLTKSMTAQVRWNNVFNKDYELANGYNTPGSTVFVNLAWRL